MPRNQTVYGKRKNNAEWIIDCFVESHSPSRSASHTQENLSPLKDELLPTNLSTNHGDIQSASSAFGKLHLQGDGDVFENIQRQSIPTGTLRRTQHKNPVFQRIDNNIQRTGTANSGTLQKSAPSDSCEIDYDLKYGLDNLTISGWDVQKGLRCSRKFSGRRRNAESKNGSGSPVPPHAHFSKSQNAKQPSKAPDISDYCRPLLDISHDATPGAKVMDFKSWGESIAGFFNVTKIAEASYGEVYRLSVKEGFPPIDTGNESVLKFIALKAPVSYEATKTKARTKTMQNRIDSMSAINDVASEVRVLKHMSTVPGFANFRDVKVMQGPLPKQFVTAWRNFNKDVKRSHFPDPGRKTSYEADQLWAVVEMQDAGQDLEVVRLETIWECWDAFWAIAISLAKGEEFAAFEHRDLHLGNICVKKVGSIPIGDIDLQQNVGFTGLETMLIDYTLSRASVKPHEDHSPSAELYTPAQQMGRSSTTAMNESTVFFDLSTDMSVFCGDESEDYQYEIYRCMRSAILHGNPSQDLIYPKQVHKAEDMRAERRLWKQYHPLTNLIWLHYILHKLSEQLIWPSSLSRESTPSNKAFSIRNKALLLEEQFKSLIESLDIRKLKVGSGGLESACDLVTWAVTIGWLRESDVIGRCDEDHEDKRDDLGDDEKVGQDAQPPRTKEMGKRTTRKDKR